MPDTVPFSLATHKPFNSVGVNATTGTSSYTYNATTSTFAIYDDSRFPYVPEGVPPPPGSMFYPLMPGSNYIAYVLTCDTINYACSGGMSSMPSGSTATQLTGEFKAFDSAMLNQMQGTGGAAGAGAIFGGPIMAGGDFFVMGSMPYQGAIDVPTNIKLIGVKFSAPLDQSTMTASNIYLFNYTDDPTAASKIAGTLAYNSGQSAVTFTPTSVLTASKKYRLVVTRSVKNSFGVPIAGMPQPGSTEPGPFMTDFKTGTGADSNAPQIVDNKIQSEALTQASVSTSIPEIGIRFNEDMDPTTFTSSSFLLQYDATYDGGDGFAEADFATGQTPLTTVSGTVEYDPFGRVAHLWFNGTLSTQKDFRITLQGNTVKDIAGNYLDGDFDGVAGGNYTYVFATNNVQDTTAPQISWADSDGFKLSVKFNAAMKKSTVTSASNWTLTGSSGVVSISGAHIEYDAFDNSVHFDGLSLTESQQYTIAASSNIKGLNNVAVDTSNNSKQFTVHGFSGAGAKGCTATGFEFGCGTNDAFNPNVMTFMPINVWPMNSFSNQTSRYNISFPVTKAIASGGMIELVFPVGFDVSQAAQSNADTESFMNKDINGPGTGTVTMASVTGNASTRKVTIVTSGASQANDYLTFELKNIVNGPASVIDWASNTGGHKVEITSKDSTSKTLEGPLSSMPFPLDKGGNGVISGKVTKTDGTTGIASAKIWLSTSRGGGFEKQTGSDGSFTFTGLPLPETSATANDFLNYWLNIEPPKSAGYLAGSSVEMKLSDETTSSTGNVIKIKQGSSVVSGKFSYNTAALNGKTVRLWASGPDGWLEYTFVLNGKTAGNDAAAACSGPATGFDTCTNYSVNISDGIWNIGVDPYTPMNVGFSAGPPPDPEFMPPAAQNITVSGTGTANFSLSSASKTITGTVVDQNNTGLTGMQVWSYDPSGTNGFGSHTETKADGTFTLKVVPGVYKVGAGKPGMPPLSEQQVTVPTTGTNTPSSLTFTFSKSDKTVKGIVLDESGNPIQFAGINASNASTQEFIPAGTNNSGYYTLFLPQGTWKIEVRAPGYGRIKTDPSGTDPTADRSVDAFSYSVTLSSSAADKSGYNFKAGAGNVTYKNITGTIKDSNNAGISGVMVWADELDATSIFTGNGNGTQTDSNGAFSVKVPANCTGADNSACTTSYRLGAHVKGVGPLQQKTGLKIAASGSALASQDWTLAATRSVTVKFYKGTIAAENLYAPAEAFVDAFNQSSNTGNNIRVAGVSSSTLELQESSYDVRAYIPGYGEVTPDSSSLTTTGSETKFVVSGNSTKTLIFAVSSNTITISGTATSGGTAIKNGWAHAFNRDTGLGNGDEVTTNDSGVFSITVPAPATGSYELVVDAPGYSAFKQQSISVTTAAIAATLTQATSAISGTVYKSGGSTAEKYAQVWAEEIGGTGFATAAVTSNGTFSLAVESGKSYNISAGNKEGKKATNTSVSAGTTGTTLTLASTANVPGAALAIAAQPKVDTVVPANGKVIDDTTNNDMKLNIEPQDLGSSSNSYSIEIESTPVMHETKSTKPFGKELDVSISDDTGTSLGLLNSTIDLTMQLEKTDVGTMITDDPALTNANIGSTLEKMELGYWDETKGNGTWMTSPTSTKVEVKNNSGDSYTVVDYDTFVTNIKSGTDNPNATGTNVTADYYADYKITMTTATNHLTTWGAIIQGSSDATAPSTPGSFVVSSAISGSTTLTWAASTDNVALHTTAPYAIYRGTTSDFSPGTALASVNALTYSDSTVGTNSYTYYYRIRAQDTSANFSTASSAVTAAYTAPSSVVPTGPSSPSSPTTPATDTTAPTISVVKVVSQNTSATITWTTNEASQTWVVYGTTTNYGKEVKTTGMVTSHTVAVTGLAPSTTYHYQIKGLDVAGNMSTSTDATFVTTSTASDQPIVKDQQPTQQIQQTPSVDTNLNAVKSDAATIAKETVEKIIQLVGKVRDLKQETSYEKSVVNKIVATVKSIKTEIKQKLVAFVTYGTPSTTVLGAGERGGVVNSFKEAFGKLPETEAEWEDVVKIANGRWPSKTSTAREDQAEKTFTKIYLRDADRTNPKDDAAVVVISYGLRPKARNVDSERAAIKSFRAIFGKNPITATDWDAVRAIAYSGAKR
ncbi:MAG TPA: carboxypeptidase regulatory-like domain-containing protein [Patescibacteria group bacterium]|nr:carboxypeptidase regulatory-like domain-containing protein [Patescibacteria group bacterium]